MAMVATGPIPGRTPMRVPSRQHAEDREQDAERERLLPPRLGRGQPRQDGDGEGGGGQARRLDQDDEGQDRAQDEGVRAQHAALDRRPRQLQRAEPDGDPEDDQDATQHHGHVARPHAGRRAHLVAPAEPGADQAEEQEHHRGPEVLRTPDAPHPSA
jgi:hypothetical protein